MKVSMNGLRRNLSQDVGRLCDVVTAVLRDDWFDKDILLESMNAVIQDSNILNCVYTEDESFSDMSDVSIESISEDEL